MARGSCVLRGRLDWAILFVIAFLVLVNVIDIRVRMRRWCSGRPVRRDCWRWPGGPG